MSMAVMKHWKDSLVRTKYTVTQDKPVSTTGGNKKRRKKNEKNLHPETDEPEALKAEAAPQARHYQGWSAHGINRYNQLFDQIEKERATPREKHLEIELQTIFHTKAETTTKQRKTTKVPVPSLPMPRHQVWSIDTVEATVPVEAKKNDPPSSSDDSDDDDEEEDGPNLD
jgi:hypothetical protein